VNEEMRADDGVRGDGGAPRAGYRPPGGRPPRAGQGPHRRSAVRSLVRAVHRWRRLTLRRATRQRLRWAIRIRGAVIALFLGVAITAALAGISPWLVPALAASVAGTVMNVAAAACVRRRRGIAPMLAWSGIGDAVLITYVVRATGGVASPFLFLYVVQVLTSALVVDATAGAVAAVLAVSFWGVAAWTAPVVTHAELPGGSEQLVWALSLVLTLVLLVLIGGVLAQRLARRERELAGAHLRLRRSMARIARAHGELQEAYGRLARAEAQLVSSEKMRSLGVLVAGLAHELGNPLTVLAGNLEPLEAGFASYERLAASVVAASGADGDPTVAREIACSAELRAETPALLANCREATERAVMLLAQLRAFGRGGAAARRLASLRPGLESTLALVRHRLPPDTAVRTSFDDVPDVACVPAELNQVFMNLLLNAADALRPGGTLSIALAAERGAVCVRVADDGTGIPPDVVPHLFEPFFTTKETGAGSGLGLAISHAIVARHGGALEVEAPPEGGAVFTVRLPLPDDDGADEATAASYG